jgi:hypothetical protein
MTNVQQRKLVLEAYSSDKWAHKVSKMSDSQVTAIFLSLMRRGKIKGV